MHRFRCGKRIEYKNRHLSSGECPYGPRGPPCPYGSRDRPILKTHLIYKDRHLSSCECPYEPSEPPYPYEPSGSYVHPGSPKPYDDYEPYEPYNLSYI